MLKAIVVLASFAVSISAAWAETTITLFFTNSGGEIQNLQITDNVCSKSMFSGHFAASDAKQIDGFCVRDASNLVAEIAVTADGSNNSPSSAVPANSSVDVSNGRVNSP
ncbi:hypothetical protein HAP41_0000022315 [Bradyrhizobium barranii subsp. apii]|uniref:Uncharacterized protein n=1 Tax=Bradyrhizobium barranii subsp. apii TaxID=2819348 RepID=A0A8T5VM91_9BRAD|nr:hypothetical protein [Bradyrhizobium barranii]UPT91416.1 hypothetical protein HAP41_0000022315 [Bradyrhizobium barranii subsp. apii]